MRKWTLGILITCSLSLVSCVGTVQETASSVTDIGATQTFSLNFNGLGQATAISDSRVELTFLPAGGGSGKYIYDIYIGSTPTPISVPSDILKPDFRGNLRYTVTGLDIMTTYQFKMEVRDQITSAYSNTGVIRTTKTFTNSVCNFDGVGSLSNMPGQDGKDSILVRYTTPRSSGSLTPEPDDPLKYELVLIDAEKFTPADMDVEASPAQGKWVFNWTHFNNMNQYVARGVQPNTKFYARLRCLHQGTKDDVYNPQMRGEMNNNYVEISTLSDKLEDILFDTTSFKVNMTNGVSGLSTVNTIWTKASGVFDHYRLYYGKQGSGLSAGLLPDLCLNEASSPAGANIFCKKIPYSSFTTLLAGLTPYATYEFRLVLCQMTSCLGSPVQRIISEPVTITLDPATLFTGITKLQAATDLDQTESITIEYEDPSQSGAFFDGLILKMRRTLDGSDVEVEITENTAPVYFRTFDPMNSTSFQVQGINYLSEEPYCFRLYPYKWDETGLVKREFENQNWKCINPKVDSPTAVAFRGFKSGIASGEYVTLDWNAPTSGYYTNYVIFWRSGNLFSWEDAKAAFLTGVASPYSYTMVSGEDLDIILPSFATGTYIFGILTYHVYFSEEGISQKWSEVNSGMLRCNVNNSNNEPFNCF